MSSIFTRIKAQLPHWNERSLTESDCFEFARERDLQVFVLKDFRSRGFCGSYQGNDFVVLNANLGRTEFLRVFLHEIGHFILHQSYARRRVLNYSDPAMETIHRDSLDVEADLFMTVALMPYRELVRLSTEPEAVWSREVELHGKKRLAIYKTWGI